MTHEIEKISVIGAGTMGRGIALSAALNGIDVVLYDIAERLLEDALAHIQRLFQQGIERGKYDRDLAYDIRDHIRISTVVEMAAEVDLVIEAAPEVLDLKQEIFVKFGSLAPARTIFATNTSSLSIEALAGASSRPDRFLGLHYFNPAHIMKLVEVIRADETSEDTIARATAFVGALGKTAVICSDTPAFIVNRVARPFYGEALRLLGENAADVETIDRLMRSIGFKMGPFQLIDLVGSDVNLAVTLSVYEQFYHDPKFRPHPIQHRMVASGRLGRKSGRGFYDYREEDSRDSTS